MYFGQALISFITEHPIYKSEKAMKDAAMKKTPKHDVLRVDLYNIFVLILT